MANLVDELMKAVKPKKDKLNKTHAATVSHIDKDGTVWVYVAGSDRETPTASAASEVKKGDSVNVEWRNNKLYIAGNYSNPSAGVVRVTNVENIANVANSIATQANQSAAVAQDAADRAIRDADTAHQAAVNAQSSADEAQASADQAQESADNAMNSAVRANNHANDALTQLSIVEDVAGTLNWISEHGTYIQTTDTTVVEGRVYFQLIDGDYVPISNPDPTANPRSKGWYVLDISDSQSDYIMAHLAVTSAGLWVLPSGQWGMHAIVDSDGNYIVDANGDYIADWQIDPVASGGYKVLLSATGMTVYDGAGVAVATYGESITFSSSRPQKIGGENNAYIQFYDSNNDGVPDSLRIVGAAITFSNGNTIDNYPTDAEMSTAISAAQSASYADAKAYTDEVAQGIQDQIDGVVETFYYDYAPTTSNYPANEWTTTALKESHEGDMFLDTSTGYSYRWLYQNNAWGWVQIPDTAATQALQTAQNALAVANGKRRVFTSTPYPPYDVGDLWMQGSSGDIMTCTTAKASGAYVASHWSKLNNYATNTAVTSAINTATNDMATNTGVASAISTATADMATNTNVAATYATKTENANAAKTATNYLTEVSNGVFAHAEGTPSDPTASTAAGVHITDEVDIIRNGQAVAQFGESAQIGKDDESRVLITSDSTEFYDDYNGLVGQITQGQVGAMWQYESLSEDDYDMLVNRTLEYQLQNAPIASTDMEVIVSILPITEPTVSSNPPVHTFLVNVDTSSSDTYTNGSNSVTCAYNASTRKITLTTTGNGSTQTVVQQKGTKDDVWDAVDQSANIPLPLTGHTIELTSAPLTGETISGSYFAGQWYTFSFTAGTSSTHGNQGSSYPRQCYEVYDASAQTIRIVPNSSQAATVLDYYRISYTSATLLLYAGSTYVKYRIAVGTPSYTFGKRVADSYKGNYSFVSGYNNSATEDLSVAFGRDTHATEENQMVIGRSSKEIESPVESGFGFLMGNGTFQPSNAFGVTWGGTPYMQLDTQGRYGDNYDFYSDAEMTEILEKLWTVDYLKSDGTIYSEMLNLKKLLSKTLNLLDGMNTSLSTVNTSVSVPSGSVRSLATQTVESGLWLFIGAGNFQSNSTGIRNLGISTSPTQTNIDRNALVTVPGSATGPNIQVTTIRRVSGSTTFYLNAYQTSGSTLTVASGFTVLKLRG